MVFLKPAMSSTALPFNSVITSPLFTPAFAAPPPGTTSATRMPSLFGALNSFASFSSSSCIWMPRKPRITLPYLMRLSITLRAWFAGTAKPMPMLPPLWLKMAELMPTSRPRRSTSAPPELPGLMDASVWMKLPNSERPVCVRPTAEMIPRVTVCRSANGLPTASTLSPDLDRVAVGESDRLQVLCIDLDDRDVAAGVRADLRRLHLRSPVRERHGDFIRLLHHVVVGDDVSVLAHDDAAAEADGHLALAAPADVLAAALLVLRHAEELAEERIVQQRVVCAGAADLAASRMFLLMEIVTTLGDTFSTIGA